MTKIGAGLASVLLAAILVAVTICYWPGLKGPYVLDDEINITSNNAIAITQLDPVSMAGALSANGGGPLGRPLASLSFALNHYFVGAFVPSTAFKATNLVIHLFNIILVFFLACYLSRTPALRTNAGQGLVTGLLCAAFWGLHPINVSSVLYVVQRMNSLAALFVLAGLLAFVHGRMMLAQNRSKALAFMYGGVIGGTALGITAKENALLLPLFALTIELFLFHERDEVTRRARIVFFLLVLILPALIAFGYLLVHPEFLVGSYKYRTFTLAERLLTEARVLWYYVYLLVAPNVRAFGLFHDDIAVSTSLLDPPTTLIAVVGWTAALATWGVARRLPLVAFAIAWYLAGHLLESTIFGLEITFEHRNYLPGIGVVFALSNGIARWITAPLPRQRIGAGILAVVAVALVALSNRIVSENWKDIESLVAQTVRNHPDSPRGHGFAVAVSVNNGDLATARYHALRAIKLAPKEAGHHIDLHLVNARLNNSSGIDERRISIGCDNLGLTWPEVLLPCLATPTPTVELLLRREPVSATMVAALVNLRHCIVNKVSGCDTLIPVASRWFAAAMANPRADLSARETIAYNAALMHAHLRDYLTAIGYLREAAEFAPGTLAYRIGEAEFLIRLGRLGEAAQVLQDITQPGRYTARAMQLNHAAIRGLGEILQARQTGSGP